MDSNILRPRQDCIYTACFCEENVWKLCEYIMQKIPEKLDKCFAVFISNNNKTIPLWHQAAADSPNEPVLWDYHVILVYWRLEDRAEVYDLDTRLPFPVQFNDYAKKTFFVNDNDIASIYRRWFRVIPAKVYLEKFASDRSHMIGETGKWLKPPPNYPCIKTVEHTNNIGDFISMDASKSWFGEVMDYEAFMKRFSTLDAS